MSESNVFIHCSLIQLQSSEKVISCQIEKYFGSNYDEDGIGWICYLSCHSNMNEESNETYYNCTFFLSNNIWYPSKNNEIYSAGFSNIYSISGTMRMEAVDYTYGFFNA
jgi:hypothetical protein